MHLVVLMTDLFDTFGGIQTFNRCLVKALDEIAARRGWMLTLLVLNDRPSHHYPQGYLNPVRVRYKRFGRNKTCYVVASLREALRASVVIIGHVNLSPLGLAMRLIRPKAHVLLVVYGLEVWSRLSFLRRYAARKVTRLLSISARTRDQMAAFNGLDPKQFEILPCTLDPFYGKNAVIKTRTDLALPAGKMILSVARLEDTEAKGIDQVIQDLPTVIEKVPDAFFVVIGDGTDRQRLERLAGTVGMQEKVIFTGSVAADLLPSYYEACDVFVLPSLLEGFGIVFLEAMHHAKTCVGARAGAIPEVIQDGTTGLLCEPGDAQALANVLIRLLTNDALRCTMGQAGRDRAQREFSFEVFLQRLETAVRS